MEKIFSSILFGLDLSLEMKRERTQDDWFIFFGPKGGHKDDDCLRLIRQCVGLLRRETSQKDKLQLLEYKAIATALTAKIYRLSEGNGSLTVSTVSDYAGGNDIPVNGIDEHRLRNFFSPANLEDSSHKGLRVNRKIPMTCVILVVHYLIEHDFLPTTGYAPAGQKSERQLAEALSEFFKSTRRTRTDLRAQFEGHFYLYRKSQHWPGRYVKASLTITPVSLLDTDGEERIPNEWALCTTESHRHAGDDGSAPITETYVGVLSRKSGYPFIISSLTGETKRERGAPRFTIIHTTLYENGSKGPVVSMTGLSVSTYGARGAIPMTICIERTTTPPEPENLGLFSGDDVDEKNKPRVPQSVITRLDLM